MERDPISDMSHLVVILSYRVVFLWVGGKGLWRGEPVCLRWWRCVTKLLVCAKGSVARESVIGIITV